MAPGLVLHRGFLDRIAQRDLLQAVIGIEAAAPLFQPVMPKTGKPFSVRMTNCGQMGWVADRQGYRYQSTHPATDETWPPMPAVVERVWTILAGVDFGAEACLVNVYDAMARMGLHQDRDEAEATAPVVSLSLGATCIFRFGGSSRRDPTRSIRLESGDALCLSGQSRYAFHGVDRIVAGTSTLFDENALPAALAGAARINLTLRRVTPASR